MTPFLLKLLISSCLIDLYAFLKLYKTTNKLAPTTTLFAKTSGYSSTKSSPHTSINTKGTPSPSPYDLIVKGDIVRLTLGQRVAFPGDYLVHEQYGIGQYLGVRYVDLTPARSAATYEPVVVLKYNDGEGIWFKRLADRELYIYRSFSTMNGPLSDDVDVVDTEVLTDSPTDSKVKRKSKKSISTNATDTAATAIATPATTSSYNQQISLLSSLCDRKKWRKRLSQVKLSSKSTAINLIKLLTIRNNFHRVPCTDLSEENYNLFRSNFKFTPTSDQLNCFLALQNDLVYASKPMDRLICGDVGFGKTEVAMHAMYIVVNSNRQVAVLAPTRVLALQHLRSIQDRMPGVRVMLLRGGSGAGKTQEVKDAVASGECQIVVGTHALLQADVHFNRLGLLVIDEEQRFGVSHKEKLKVVSSGLDVLTLSATPIPRTLSMAVSGLRDMSLMTQPPQGRKEVKVLVDVWNTNIVREAITNELARQGQVFIVVPFISDCEILTYAIGNLTIPGVKLLEAHGRCDDLEDRIDRFRYKQANVLIATTVIENGVDMPNVNTIIVYCADRFGMSALYQLRGRVGRCDKQAYAYFLTNSTIMTADAENRLTYLKTFTALGSGYELSMRDMDMRGSGSLFGEQQSGSSDLGIDLQARVLAEALNNLKGDVLLPVTETRVSLCLPAAVEQWRWIDKRALSSEDYWLCQPPPPLDKDRDRNIRTATSTSTGGSAAAGAAAVSEAYQQLLEANLNQVSVWEDECVNKVLRLVFPSPGPVEGGGIPSSDTGPVPKATKRKSATATTTTGSANSIATTFPAAAVAVAGGRTQLTKHEASITRMLTSILTAASSDDFENIYKMCLDKYLSLSPTTAAAGGGGSSVAAGTASSGITGSAAEAARQVLPPMLIEMLQRAELRLLCRKLGITDLVYVTKLATIPLPAATAAAADNGSADAVATLYKPVSPVTSDTGAVVNSGGSSGESAPVSLSESAQAPTTVLCVAAGMSSKKWNSLQAGVPLPLRSRVQHSSLLYVHKGAKQVVTHQVSHLALTLSDQSSTPTPAMSATQQMVSDLKSLLQGLNTELVAVFDKATADCVYEKPSGADEEEDKVKAKSRPRSRAKFGSTK